MNPRAFTRPRVGLAALVAGLALAGLAVSAQETAERRATAPADATEQRIAGENLISQAKIQAELDELDAAEKSYLDGIELITNADGEFASALIGAYRGLADVFARRGDYPEAVTVLEQARHISHRNFGLFNLDQAELLDELSEVYEDAGDTRQAQEMQREMLGVAVKHFGGENVGVIPYHFRLAEYYELARMRGLAREQYAQALEILAEDPDAAPADSLKPLRELLRIDTLLGEQTGSQRRLTEALDSVPDAPASERAESLAVLGDAELAGGDFEQAQSLYADAYAAYSDPAAADDFFRSPRMINFVPPPGPVDWGRRRNRDYAWGSITLAFALSPQGRARQIEVVNSDPPGLMDARYVQRIAEATFRPRLVDGLAVETPRLRYSHEFRYFLPEAD